MWRRFRLFFLIECLILAALLIADARSKKFTQETTGTTAREDPRVALTFDDGPSEYTMSLLDGLRERGVKATFFLQGQCIEGREKIIRQMQEDGHLIGNHTFHHVQLTKLSDEQAKQEVVSTSNAIFKITGIYTAFIRPPFGEWKKGLDYNVTMIPVLWTLDSRDWYTQNTPVIVNEVMKQVDDGDIILMHDCFQTSVESALQIVDRLKEQGYEFVTVDEMIVE
ncbi:polysaccharide deacetylase family protein [Novisyntrophococcus fermenticellae]|uniref:polysaccharide deacetylase family protein n=1 Tax=Novisyntrophococcus fermenticellae TaxID=2068655 RepID=UPI001E5211CE|nr:polysaccharide deacetylase family protein [Novisyntrophococcus fermenticellae]